MLRTLIAILLINILFVTCKKDKELVYEYDFFGVWQLTTQYYDGKKQEPLTIFKAKRENIDEPNEYGFNVHAYEMVIYDTAYYANPQFIFNISEYGYRNDLQVITSEPDTINGSWHLDLVKQKLQLSLSENDTSFHWDREPLTSKVFVNITASKNSLTLSNDNEEFVFTKRN